MSRAAPLAVALALPFAIATAACAQALGLDDYAVAPPPPDAPGFPRSDWAQRPLPATFDAAIDGATVATVSDAGAVSIPNLFTYRLPPGAPVPYAEAPARCATLGAGWELPTRVELVTLWDPRGGGALPAAPGLAGRAYWSQTQRLSNGGSPSGYWVGDFGERGANFLRVRPGTDSADVLCVYRGAK